MPQTEPTVTCHLGRGDAPDRMTFVTQVIERQEVRIHLPDPYQTAKIRIEVLRFEGFDPEAKHTFVFQGMVDNGFGLRSDWFDGGDARVVHGKINFYTGEFTLSKGPLPPTYH